MGDKPLDPKEFEGWTPIAQVYRSVIEHMFGHEGTVNEIVRRLQKGLIRAGAENHAFAHIDHDPEGVIQIGRERWARDWSEEYDFWRSGTFSADDDGDLDTVTFFGVKLEPAGIEKMMGSLGGRKDLPVLQFPGGKTWVSEEYDDKLPAVETAPPSSPAAAPKGGRPPKAFWEALWVEMACQVWAGDIGPESRQADIQRAMEEWATANDEDASPATFKNAARALLQALREKKGKNPAG